MEFALKSEIYCFIQLHSLLRIVFVHNIYYIFAKLSLANIRPRFSNKPIVHSRHRGRYTQKFKNNHFTFLKNIELRLFNRKESQSNSPVQLSSPAVQCNCPVQLSSPVQSMFCTMPLWSNRPVHVLYNARRKLPREDGNGIWQLSIDIRLNGKYTKWRTLWHTMN